MTNFHKIAKHFDLCTILYHAIVQQYRLTFLEKYSFWIWTTRFRNNSMCERQNNNNNPTTHNLQWFVSFFARLHEMIGGRRKKCRINNKKNVWKFNSHGIQIRFQRIRTVNRGRHQHRHPIYSKVIKLYTRFSYFDSFVSGQSSGLPKTQPVCANTKIQQIQLKIIMKINTIFITYNLMADSHIGCYSFFRLEDNNSIFIIWTKKNRLTSHQRQRRHWRLSKLPKLQSNTWFYYCSISDSFILHITNFDASNNNSRTSPASLEQWFAHPFMALSCLRVKYEISRVNNGSRGPQKCNKVQSFLHFVIRTSKAPLPGACKSNAAMEMWGIDIAHYPDVNKKS